MYKFEKLIVWRKSVELIKLSTEIVKELPRIEERNLSDQLRRSVLSISLNIAEGSGSNTDKEFRRYLFVSRKSLFEVAAIIKIIELIYPRISTAEFSGKLDEVGKILSGLINSLKSSN